MIDPVGGDRFTDSLRSLREGGRVVYEPAAFSLEEGLGASAELTLAFVRFDVTNFEKRLTRDDLLRLPRDFEVHRVARLVRALETATC